MVHEVVGAASRDSEFDFDFDFAPPPRPNPKRQHQDLQRPATILQRSRSSSGFACSGQQDLGRDLVAETSVATASATSSPGDRERVLPNSAEHLSWTFLEKVASLDNRPRASETSAPRTTGRPLMTAATSDARPRVVDEQPESQTEYKSESESEAETGRAHPLTIANKSNGITPAATLLAVDVVPQQAPDIILQQHTRTPSTVFDAPTGTFRRKQQLLHPTTTFNNNNQRGLATSNNHSRINCNSHCSNNVSFYNALPETGTSSSTETATTTTTPQPPTSTATIEPRQIEPSSAHFLPIEVEARQQQQEPVASNARARAMIGDSDLRPTATGNCTTSAKPPTSPNPTGTATKLRSLPAIGRRPSAYAEDAGEASSRAAGFTDRSDRGGKMGAASRTQMSSQSFVEGIEANLGLLGWRKKCLYTLLVLLMLLIVVNLALTLWILKVMEFSTDGMGQLRIVPGGIQLTGQALIMDMLRASTIRSRHGQPISIESSRNFSINTRDTNGILENHLFLGHDKLECLSTGFRINDTAGRNLFSVNRDEVAIGAHALRIDGEGGAIFRESVQTQHVRAEPGQELRLESPTRQLEMTAAKDINLQSRAGGIELSALEDVKLSALDGSLRLESSKILMPNLRTVQPPLPGAPQSREHLHRVFQLCACSNGKLFLAAPHSICAGDDSTVCR